MHRNAWIMAASLIARHGMDALTVVSEKLYELNRCYVAGSFGDEDAASMTLWREIGAAVLAITNNEPSGAYSVN